MTAINFTSLNKTNGHSPPKKCLFTLRMMRVLLSVGLKLLVLLPNFSQSDKSTVRVKGKTVGFSIIFLY